MMMVSGGPVRPLSPYAAGLTRVARWVRAPRLDRSWRAGSVPVADRGRNWLLKLPRRESHGTTASSPARHPGPEDRGEREAAIARPEARRRPPRRPSDRRPGI